MFISIIAHRNPTSHIHNIGYTQFTTDTTCTAYPTLLHALYIYIVLPASQTTTVTISQTPASHNCIKTIKIYLLANTLTPPYSGEYGTPHLICYKPTTAQSL